MAAEKPRQARPANPQLTLQSRSRTRLRTREFLCVWLERTSVCDDRTLAATGRIRCCSFSGRQVPAKATLAHMGFDRQSRHSIRPLPLAAADIEGLAAAGPLLLEDADAIGESEAQLFHLVNLMRERGTALVRSRRKRHRMPGACGPPIFYRGCASLQRPRSVRRTMP